MNANQKEAAKKLKKAKELIYNSLYDVGRFQSDMYYENPALSKSLIAEPNKLKRAIDIIDQYLNKY